ncbi:hypothetical protein PENTCL1PPCAC_22015 [Pristionchus entomophagus]|uniref:GST C-terminal domain-containing protein n=1 Tax=Pristionchus entomophagus TaxID=358040 RepID=A0AAV5TZZ6_9BILA|nr:hypothetical protein PENTCL1PPCAC_22015 [Pristionchus entomophagus]
MPSTALLKRDWQKQHVYMIQYPRCRVLPNLSPWSLKLETWLRMADIPFTNINNEFKKFSSKGQVPFVELNGRQIADSNIIIDTLKQEFGKGDMDSSDPKDQSLVRAYTALAEDHLTWAMFAMRWKMDRFNFVLTDDGFGRYFGTGMKKRLNHFMIKRMNKKLVAGRANAQGMGRHSSDELHEIAKETLKSMCIFLGDKPYFGGDRPTTLDATMFGHLAGLVYIPTPNGLLTKYVKETYPNLCQFMERIKEKPLPNLSPWSLKLETWLRMAEIPFTNINNEFKIFSSKGQVPFIELNGRQIADSNIIIETLKHEFGKENMDPTDPKEQSLARAFTALAEDHLTWAMFAMRSKTGGFNFTLTDDGWGRYHGTGMKRRFTQFMLKRMSKRLVTDRANAQGMGRHSPDELHEIAKEALKSMCIFLGDKPYFGGDRATTLDATMFGHLASLIYIPTPNGVPNLFQLLTKYVKETYPNLGQFVERIKEKYWPDWEETCSTMNMNTHHKKE